MFVRLQHAGDAVRTGAGVKKSAEKDSLEGLYESNLHSFLIS